MSIFATLAPPVRNSYGFVKWAYRTHDGIYDTAAVAEIASALSVVWFASQSNNIPLFGIDGGWTVEERGDKTNDWADVSLRIRYEGALVAVVILDGLEG